MIIFFARNGKPLGNLNWKTDRIPLMTSGSHTLSKEEREKMQAGHYISGRTDPITKLCNCDYCIKQRYPNNIERYFKRWYLLILSKLRK